MPSLLQICVYEPWTLWITMDVSGEAFLIFEPCFLIQRIMAPFSIWTTGRQLKQYPGEYMFITQAGEGHSKKDWGFE